MDIDLLKQQTVDEFNSMFPLENQEEKFGETEQEKQRAFVKPWMVGISTPAFGGTLSTAAGVDNIMKLDKGINRASVEWKDDLNKVGLTTTRVKNKNNVSLFYNRKFD